jgi:hypothetical protein
LQVNSENHIFSNFPLPGSSDSGVSYTIRKSIKSLKRKYSDFFENSLNLEGNSLKSKKVVGETGEGFYN